MPAPTARPRRDLDRDLDLEQDLDRDPDREHGLTWTRTKTRNRDHDSGQDQDRQPPAAVCRVRGRRSVRTKHERAPSCSHPDCPLAARSLHTSHRTDDVTSSMVTSHRTGDVSSSMVTSHHTGDVTSSTNNAVSRRADAGRDIDVRRQPCGASR